MEIDNNDIAITVLVFYGITITLLLFIALDQKKPETIYEDKIIEVTAPAKEIEYTITERINTEEIDYFEEKEYRKKLGLKMWEELPPEIEITKPVYKENVD